MSVGSPPGEVDAARIDVLVERAERDIGELAARGEIVDIIVDVGGAARRRIVVAEIEIADAALIGRFAPGIGIGGAQIDAEIAELELADQLGVDQLPLEPIGVLLDQRRRQVGVLIGDVAVEAGREPALLQRVADEQVGPADLVLAEVRRRGRAGR